MIGKHAELRRWISWLESASAARLWEGLKHPKEGAILKAGTAPQGKYDVAWE